MDNNESPTPDPDATTRRRSGRVVRAPAKFTPEPTTQSSNPKRKRDEQDDDEDEEDVENEAPDSDEEMSDEPENDSDHDHPAPRSRKKSSQTSRAKKPSSKKPKINGTQPARPARSTQAAKSLPSRPKKTVRIEDAAENGTGLFVDLFGTGDQVKSVAADWLGKYRDDEAAGLTDLVNCILQCAGCDQGVAEDDIRDPENIPNRLVDLQSVYQEQQITDYPLISRAKSTRSFREILVTFFRDLIVAIHDSEVMYKDESLIDNLHAWLASMSSSSLRPFRHTATTIALSVQTGLVEVANMLDGRISFNGQNLQKGKSKAKAAAVQGALEQANEYRKTCSEAIQSFFDTVFVHRYRDVDPKIRTECVEALGNWIMALPTIFLEPGYLRYLGWMLSDTNATTRHEVLKQLTRVFRRDASQLGHFIDRFRPRLVEMACKDSEVFVRVTAIAAIDVLRGKSMLEAEEIDSIGKLIFDNELRIRKAVVGFFVACVQEAHGEKLEKIGGPEVMDEIPKGKKDDPVDAPRADWANLKCLAETLAIYDNEIEKDNEGSQGLGLDIIVDLLEATIPDTRISLASQVLYERVKQIQNWTILAGYLLFDHTTSSKSKSKGNDAEVAFKRAVAPTSAEESILLDVLSSAVKSSLAQASEHDRGKRRLHHATNEDWDPEDMAVELVGLIPNLLSKFGAEPDTAAIVLRLAHFLHLDVFQQLRQDTAKYEKLLDEISTQFNRHDDKRVLSEAATALLHSRQYDELEELTDSKLSNLWETVIAALRNFDKTCELSARGNLTEAPIKELTTVLLKISKLASISDCVDVLEAEGSSESAESTTSPVIQILANIVHRGKYEPLDDEDIDDFEDEVVSFAIKTCQFYFMWKTRAISKLLSSGVSIADAELDRLSILRQTFRRHLIETLSSRAAIDQVRLFATGSLCDLHLTFATLRPTIEHFRPSSSSGSQATGGEKFKTLIQEIEPGLVPELVSIFDGAERQYAKKSKKDKTLNEPADDEDPIADDDEDLDEDEEDENLTEEERFAAELKAEKALCELTAKYVLTITAKLVDNRGSHAGKLRRRLQRNQNKLGHNFKEVVTYLDEEKLAERTRKKAASVLPPTAAAAAKPQKPQLSEAIIVAEDEEDDDIFDDTPPPEEGSREDLRRKEILEEDPIEDDEDEEEENEAERPAHDSDDEVLGD
ncbi:hypothetical protein FZEAL_8102 [Fusarium zealandicum]|uniref:SCD domain-containing protein n=1 Tax=Fusarium zealandicum TaxID=1053134 RepID=A0A8H4UFA8_9HYPO|nr:hypothetical protein FZEAL_8102 [Fusarium zealandicum]